MAIAQFTQQTANDAFRFEPFGQPAVLHLPPCGFFLNRLMQLRRDIGFLCTQGFVPFAEPLHQRLPFGVEFSAVVLQPVFEVEQVAPLGHQASMQFLVVQRESLPRLFNTQSGFFITADSLRNLCPCLFNGESQLEIGAVCFFQFDP